MSLAFTGGFERSNFRRSRLESPPGKIDTSDTEGFRGLVWIVPAANRRVRQAGSASTSFPLLSDMNRKMLKAYGHPQGLRRGKNENVRVGFWPRQTSSSTRQGVVQFVEGRRLAPVDPNTALTMCTTLPQERTARKIINSGLSLALSWRRHFFPDVVWTVAITLTLRGGSFWREPLHHFVPALHSWFVFGSAIA